MKIRSTFYDSERMNQTALGGLCKTHEYKYMETNIQENKRKLEELKEAAKPLIKFLCENYHPHVTAIVTPTSER